MTEELSAEALEPKPPETDAEKPAKPRRRWLRRTLWGLLIFVLLLAVLIALLPTIISTNFATGKIAGAASEALKREVSIQDLSVGWTSGVALDGLRIQESSGALFAGVEQLTCRVRILPLLKGDVIVDELKVVKP